MSRAVVYTRWSPRPNDAAANCLSCEVQRAQCEGYAYKKGLTIAEAFDDPDRSGADECREQLVRAVQALKKGDVLLVYKLDRIARNVYLFESVRRQVERRGATIEAVSGDAQCGDEATTALVRTILAACAEYERKLIATRTAVSMNAMQRAGRRMSSSCPYGWSPDPNDPARMVPNEKEREVVARIRELRDAGKSLGEICEWLHANRPGSARSGTWYSATVYRVYKRAAW